METSNDIFIQVFIHFNVFFMFFYVFSLHIIIKFNKYSCSHTHHELDKGTAATQKKMYNNKNLLEKKGENRKYISLKIYNHK